MLVTGRGDHHSQLGVATETIVADTAVSTYRYDPFGQTTHATGAEAGLHRWRFAGAYLDATGLYKIVRNAVRPAAPTMRAPGILACSGVAPPTWEGGEPLVWGRPDFSGWEFNPLSLAINVVQAGASWAAKQIGGRIGQVVPVLGWIANAYQGVRAWNRCH